MDFYSKIDNKNKKFAADDLSKAEKVFIDYLFDNLGSEWNIYFKPELNGSHPDVIIVNPFVGFMVYSIIDCSPMEIQSMDPVKLCDRVLHYKNKIIQLIPDMGEKLMNDSNLYASISTGIYFHQLSGNSAGKFVKNELQPRHRHFKITGFDDLIPERIYEVVPAKKYHEGNIELKWAHELEFWLDPPVHPRKLRTITLNPKQEKNTVPESGHYRLKGFAGSGKTLVIAERAAKLASADFNKRVLVLGFNRTLWPHIHQMVDSTPFEFKWSNISFNYFYGFCRDILADLSLYNPEDFKLENLHHVVHRVEEALKKTGKKELDKLKYDAILIDEGQDFEDKWYRFLCNFLSQRNEVFLVCDEKQNIYDNDMSWIDKRMKGFSGKWRRLDNVYRLPEKIGLFLESFSDEFNLDQEIEMENGIQMKLMGKQPEPYVKWYNMIEDDWQLYLLDAYQTIKSRIRDNHVDDESLAILFFTNEMARKCLRFFNRLGIEVNHVMGKDNQINNKKLFSMNDYRLIISTVHKFKGLEAQNIIIVTPDKWIMEERLDGLLYTSMTRARERLIILNANEKYWEFGKSETEKELGINHLIDSADEYQNHLKPWIESLPHPVASILNKSFENEPDDDKIRYLLEFFQIFSEFSVTLKLTFLMNQNITGEKIKKYFGTEETQRYWYGPTLEDWNSLGRHMDKLIFTSSIKNELAMESGYHEFLNKISSPKLNDILQEVSSESEIWNGYGNIDSPKELERRLKFLLNMLSQLSRRTSDLFENIVLFLPVGKLNDENNEYVVIKFKGVSKIFEELKITSPSKMELGKLYILTKNSIDPLKLLPLVLIRDDICYFFNGKDEEYVEEDSIICNHASYISSDSKLSMSQRVKELEDLITFEGH